MRDNSAQLNRLRQAVPLIETATFLDPTTKKPVSTDIPCIRNLAFTVNSFILLWKRLKKVGFTELNQRYVNQDPMENMYGESRLLGQTCTMPTCQQFSAYFAILLMRHLHAGFILNKSNCQGDGARGLFQWQETSNERPEYKDIPIRRKPNLTNIAPGLSQRFKRDIAAKIDKLPVCESCYEALSNRLDTFFAREISPNVLNTVSSYYEENYLIYRVCHRLLKELNLSEIVCKDDVKQVTRDYTSLC